MVSNGQKFLIGVIIVVGAFLVAFIVGSVWARIGFIAGTLLVIAGVLLLAWIKDRRDREKRAGLDELPRV